MIYLALPIGTDNGKNVHSTTEAADSPKAHSTGSVHSTTKKRNTRNSLRSAASTVPKSSGKLKITDFVLRKKKSKRKPKKCTCCKNEFPTYIALAVHIKKDHPKYEYKCKYCPKTFASASWKYQHQARHKGLKYQCSVNTCNKLFQFTYQLWDHIKKHTRKGLYTCSVRGCKKPGFTTIRARNYHEQGHFVQDKDQFICDFKEEGSDEVCGKTFARKNLYTQHRNGHVGKKYVARCGKIFNWPNARKYHQDNCDECKRIKDKKLKRFKKEK